MRRSPRDLAWERSASLVSAERGDLQNEFIEITEDEANQIVAANPRRGNRHEQRLTLSGDLHPLECSSQLAMYR